MLFGLILVTFLQTIDLNLSELEYLANHLTNEECRRLTAAIHFVSYEEPNPLDQAERKIPKDLKCLDLLLHWNSASGEGRGQTHEIIEHRLRQMGKYKLADWLGRTVFRELSNDLEESLHVGLKPIVDNTTKKSIDLPMPPIDATVNSYDIYEWTSFDTIGLVVLVLLISTIFGLCLRICLVIIVGKLKKRRDQYKPLTDSESEYTLFEMPL